MQGAIKKLDSCSTNTERIEGTCKIVEEFFRTLGIILYTRYVNVSNENDIAFTAEILNLLANHFEKPTFDSWQRLYKNCIEELLKRNDKFAIECNHVIEQNVDDQNKAKAIMKEIHSVISQSPFSPPRRTSYLNFLDAIRLLRNFISHQRKQQV